MAQSKTFNLRRITPTPTHKNGRETRLQMGSETTIPVFERWKTVQALNRAASVTGYQTYETSFDLGITPTRVKFILYVRNVTWRQSSGRIELKIMITENVRTERLGRKGGTPAASFRRPLFESRLSSNPLCKCWILQPMSNSAPTVRILSKHLLSISFSTRDKWVPVTTAWCIIGLRTEKRPPT